MEKPVKDAFLKASKELILSSTKNILASLDRIVYADKRDYILEHLVDKSNVDLILNYNGPIPTTIDGVKATEKLVTSKLYKALNET